MSPDSPTDDDREVPRRDSGYADADMPGETPPQSVQSGGEDFYHIYECEQCGVGYYSGWDKAWSEHREVTGHESLKISVERRKRLGEKIHLDNVRRDKLTLEAFRQKREAILKKNPLDKGLPYLERMIKFFESLEKRGTTFEEETWRQ